MVSLCQDNASAPIAFPHGLSLQKKGLDFFTIWELDFKRKIEAYGSLKGWIQNYLHNVTLPHSIDKGKSQFQKEGK